MLNLRRNYDNICQNSLSKSVKYMTDYQSKVMNQNEELRNQKFCPKQKTPSKNQSSLQKGKTLKKYNEMNSESKKLHWYLKEYQYNTYLQQNDKQQQFNKSNQPLHFLNPLNQLTPNFQYKHYQKLQKQISINNHQIKKQEIILLKHLRQQNAELKLQIEKKNVYIQQLEVKLEAYLKERVQIEKQSQLLCQNLELKLSSATQQIRRLQKQIDFYQQEQEEHLRILQSLKAYPQLEIIENDASTLSKVLKNFQQLIKQKNTMDQFIHKIQEMKNKIENKTKLQHTKQTQKILQNQFINQKTKSVNLKQLWKWLKSVAKQYEMIKEKVSSMKKEQKIDLSLQFI